MTYYRKSKGIALLRRLCCTNGRTKKAGDNAGVHITVGDLKEAVREYDELYDVTRAKAPKPLKE